MDGLFKEHFGRIDFTDFLTNFLRYKGFFFTTFGKLIEFSSHELQPN